MLITASTCRQINATVRADVAVQLRQRSGQVLSLDRVNRDQQLRLRRAEHSINVLVIIDGRGR
jgi:hypothetical protein